MSTNSKEKILREIFEDISLDKDRGKLADYIPELKNSSLEDLSLVLRMNSGEEYRFGDYFVKFSLQSISKILALALALEDNPREDIEKKVGFKPTEETFNTFSRLEEDGYLPANPMINAGAIVTTSLIKGDRLKRLLDFVAKATGKESSYNEKIYRSESRTGDRNRAIAYILKNKGLLQEDFEEVLETYFKQCSIEVDSLDLSKLGHIFSSGGYSIFGEKLLREETVKIVNATMLMAGMYNYSGEFAVDVGLPSKSGVSGGILSIIPDVGNLVVYSPGLDEIGNSKLGQKLLKAVAKELNYSIF